MKKLVVVLWLVSSYVALGAGFTREADTVLQLMDPAFNAGFIHTQASPKGYFVVGDGGGGSYWWDPNSVDTADGGSVLEVTNVTVGRWKAIFDPPQIYPIARWGIATNVSRNFAQAYAVSKGGGVILWPRGSSQVSGTLYGTNNVQEAGDAGAAVVGSGAGPIFDFTGNTNWMIANLTISGATTLLRSSGSTNGIINNNQFQGATTGIRLSPNGSNKNRSIQAFNNVFVNVTTPVVRDSGAVGSYLQIDSLGYLQVVEDEEVAKAMPFEMESFRPFQMVTATEYFEETNSILSVVNWTNDVFRVMAGGIFESDETSAFEVKAGKGKWYANASDSHPHYLNDLGVDFDLTMGLPAGSDTMLQINTFGVMGATTNLRWTNNTTLWNNLETHTRGFGLYQPTATNLVVTGINTGFTPGFNSYVRVTSDNADPALRAFTIQEGSGLTPDGQFLLLHWISTNGARIVNGSGNAGVFMSLTADWTPKLNDTLLLLLSRRDTTNWIEIGRGNAGSGGGLSYSDLQWTNVIGRVQPRIATNMVAIDANNGTPGSSAEFNVFADGIESTANYGRLRIREDSNQDFLIETEKAGTHAIVHPIRIRTSDTGNLSLGVQGADKWTISGISGELSANGTGFGANITARQLLWDNNAGTLSIMQDGLTNMVENGYESVSGVNAFSGYTKHYMTNNSNSQVVRAGWNGQTDYRFSMFGSTVGASWGFYTKDDLRSLQIEQSGSVILGPTATTPGIGGSISYRGTTLQPTTNWTSTAGQTVVASATWVRLTPASAITVTATPSVANSSTPTREEGTDVWFIGSSDVNTVTFQDESSLAGSELQLQAATRTLGKGDILHLHYVSADGFWYEAYFGDN